MSTQLGMTDAHIRVLLRNLHRFSAEEAGEIERMVDELLQRRRLQAARDDLIEFCKYMQPDYKVGRHHRILADMLMAIERGDKDRICVSLPPRHGKSQLVSLYFAAWFMGRNPGKKLMLVSHTTDLAVDFGRKVRNLIADPAYKALFPDTVLATDSKSAGRWNTTYGGEFYAAGVGSSIAGRGADLLVVDDPHSEQDILNGNFSVFEKAYEWFTFGARTRLMPGGSVAIVHTRWSADDLIGRVIRDMTQREGADQYEVVEFPALLEVEEPDPDAEPLEDGEQPMRLVQKPLWPEFFDLKALLRTKASMPAFQWNAQYQQNPTSEGAALVKREWWREWPTDTPPDCDYIIATLDAAAEAKERADFTAVTVWGVFFNEQEDMNQLILLYADKRRVEFPELKEMALEVYQEWEPDAFIVEKKSSGTPLYQELRRMGIMVQEYTPVRGSKNNPNTKFARLNSVADIVKSGIVWIPQKRWAEELVEEVAGFPAAPHDDLCFVAGTMITMADGSRRRIADVQVGDYVRTPAGPRPVTQARYTGVREVCELRVAGRRLVGTGNHPIATTTGWKRLDTITMMDTIKMAPAIWRTSWLGLPNPVLLWSRLCSTAANSIATLSQSMRRFGDISGAGAAGASACTGLSGNTTTGLSLSGGMSTTRTGTSITTTSPTLSAYPRTSTPLHMLRIGGLSGAAQSILPTSIASGRRLRSGIALKRAKHGTPRTQQSTSGSEALRGGQTKPAGIAKLLTRFLGAVRSATRSFCRQLAVRSSAAMRAPAAGVPERSGSAPVYNLSVAGAHCFYANDVLVHNCDCLIMSLMRFRQGGFIRLPSDDTEEDNFLYRPPAAYY